MSRRRTTAGALGAIVVTALLLATLATARGGDARLYPAPAGPTVTVYLVDNGFHTDLALPRAALQGHISGQAAAQATALPWVAVGWGDARFFVGTGMSARRLLDGLRALLAPGNTSAVRIEGLAASPDRVYLDGVHRLVLSPAGARRLIARLDAAFLRGPDGAPITLAAPPEPDSRYFRSGEAFSLIHLCNHWTAELLNAAGLPITPVLDTVPAGLMLDLRLRAKA